LQLLAPLENVTTQSKSKDRQKNR